MNNREGNTFRYYLELSKIKIMVPVSLTGFTGFFLYNPHFTDELLFLTAGILLLAISASVLNQIQEIAYDDKMERTHNRPLPSGKITIRQALVFFTITFSSGILLIWLTGSFTVVLISLFTIIWYNGIYTYLKRITPYAVIPGALTGALPPLIGWVAAGGSITDRTIIIIQILFFIGQIPHFWLFILKYGDEYLSAGFPSLTSVLDRGRIKKLILIWIIASAFGGTCLVFFGIIRTRLIVVSLMLASFLLILAFIKFAFNESDQRTGRYSRVLDAYFLLIIVLLNAEKML